jgi:UDPglucose 6-dehydrogenase
MLQKEGLIAYLSSSLCFSISADIGAYHTYTNYPCTPSKTVTEMRPHIGVIGTGYVGLVTGAGLAECGNIVVCTDINSIKIKALQEGIIPIYEPGLEELVARNVEQERLSFNSDVAGTLHEADIIFIAVGTPTNDDGSVDLRALEAVINTIGTIIDKYTIIVTKSTVPVGTGQHIRYLLEQVHGIHPSLFSVVANPEFLREGSAVHDFLEPDRLVIGTESMEAQSALCVVYQHLLSSGTPCVFTNIPTAEIIKYASNAFLATKLSFINEIACLCDATDGNAQTVAYAMGLDHRISPYFLRPGPGYGGSCFPKDTQALVHIANKYSIAMNTVQGSITTNNTQQRVPVNKLINFFENGCVEGKTIAILGLAFKANTDDIRCSPSITAIKQLQALGASINAYDPQATAAMKLLFPDIHYCTSAYEAMTNADAALIMTEWEEFKHLNIKKIASLMHNKIIIDARNILDAEQLHLHGFLYAGIGQGSHDKKPLINA